MPSIRLLARYTRPLVIVLGFLSSLVGTLGSFLLIESLNRQLKSLADQKNRAVHEIDKLGALASEYFIANQQGDLIYALSLQGNSRQDLVRLIYQGNVLDRAVPVRNVIGALAIARLVDYKQTYGAYEKLSDAARQSHEFREFAAVKAFEREVVERAQQRVSELQLGLLPLQQEMTRVEADLRRRQVALLAFSSVGAFLLLLANLVEHRSKVEPAPPGDDAPAS